MRRYLLALGIVVAAVVLVAVIATFAPARSHAARPNSAVGIHKIKHVIVIMQENRSFDQYFGTYPGADGFPRDAAATRRLQPESGDGGMRQAVSRHTRSERGGPHGQNDATSDIDGGKMDGFVANAETAKVKGCANNPNNPICSQRATNPDVMGYHDGRDIPNYWTYARNFVLQDHMFEPNASWSLPAHLFMVSEWSARCTNRNDPFSCTNALQSPARRRTRGPTVGKSLRPTPGPT